MNDKLIEIISAQLGIERQKITAGSAIMDDLGADSLDIVEMLAALERDTGIFVPDEEIPNMRTVGDIEKFIDSHGGEAQSSDQEKV